MIPKELLPQPALRIGITGRRHLTVASPAAGGSSSATVDVTEAMRPLVAGVLAAAQQAAREEFRKSRHLYRDEDEPPDFRAISPLAEGADRLFAEEAIRLGYRLLCPLPFARDDYARDFRDPQSASRFGELLAYAGDAVFELDGRYDPESERSAAYETVGRLVVDQCDLLLALWDGKPDQGPGGTLGILQFSAGRVPVVCLRIDGKPNTIHGHWGRGKPEEYSPETLQRLVGHILAPPRQATGHPKDGDLNGAYIQDLDTRPPFLGWFWKKFLWFLLIGRKVRPPAEQHVPQGPFLRYYQRFDAYANRLSGLYRGAFLLNYQLGVLAVVLALLGFAARLPIAGQPAPKWIEAAFPVLELITILTILVMIRLLGKLRWHYRSIDCRYLGEQFRVMCYLHSLGLAPPHPRLPAHHAHHDIQKSWMEWLLRAIVRQTPMKHGLLDAEAVERLRSRMLDWVHSQIHYHRNNAEKMQWIEASLRRLIWSSLVVILLACSAHLFLPEKSRDDLEKPILDVVRRIVSHQPSPAWDQVRDQTEGEARKLTLSVLEDLGIAWWLTALAAGLPAFSAACHAIATQGEFERLAERSEAMTERLELLAGSLRDLGKRPFTFGELREEARNVAELVVEEVMDWQILYRKPVPPP